MQRTSRVPDGRAVVVGVVPGAILRRRLPTVGAFALVATLAWVTAAATGEVAGLWGVLGVLCLAGLVAEVLGIRSELALGPVLAADREHVWVRTGGVLAPRSVRLAWAELEGVTIHSWQGRKKAAARYLTLDLTSAAERELTDRRLHRMAELFGSPLAISDQHKDTTLDEVLRHLRDVAPEDVRFTVK